MTEGQRKNEMKLLMAALRKCCLFNMFIFTEERPFIPLQNYDQKC